MDGRVIPVYIGPSGCGKNFWIEQKHPDLFAVEGGHGPMSMGVRAEVPRFKRGYAVAMMTKTGVRFTTHREQIMRVVAATLLPITGPDLFVDVYEQLPDATTPYSDFYRTEARVPVMTGSVTRARAGVLLRLATTNPSRNAATRDRRLAALCTLNRKIPTALAVFKCIVEWAGLWEDPLS